MPTDSENRNRLADESSPYLLQHADNPVDWYPWGEAAFAAARRQDRPIFLSIGYATCHWCHVMEHESFEDADVAELMNRTFVNVKVDREERPDVDDVYMTVAQMLTGGGGWPLTIIMTPDGQPFYAATYIPRESRLGRPGMTDLVPRISQLWREQRDTILGSAQEISSHLERAVSADVSGAVDPGVVDAAYEQLARRFDPVNGGFGTAPKFPSPHTLLFLLSYGRLADEPKAVEMVERTLSRMRRGGIWDHLGFGFHRYSTDAEWLLPHFEKMLYDQAMLALAFSEAFDVTGDERYARTVREILRYVLRDMTSPEGAFYSAEDADSEGEEGRFYVWTLEQLRSTLPAADLELVTAAWGARESGNFHDEATGRPTGANILHQPADEAEIANRLGIDETELRRRLEEVRRRLFADREQRVHPLKDDKVLADWNGLMAAAFARAGRVLDDPEMVGAARRAVDFVEREMRAEDGTLMHRWRNGDLAVPAFLDDHVFLAWACLELYDATLEPVWLGRALDLQNSSADRFWDAEGGGFFSTSETAERLLVRPKDAYDGAIPSGNSVAMTNLIRLGHLTGRTELVDRGHRVARSFSAMMQRAPSGFAHLVAGLQWASTAPAEVVVVGPPERDDTRGLVDAVRAAAKPNVSLLLVPTEGTARDTVLELAPFAKGYTEMDGRAAAYVCRNFSCDLPVTTPEAVAARIAVETPKGSTS